MKNVDFKMGHVKCVDTVNKTITTQYGTTSYDKLIIAAGTTNNFFGNDKLRESVFTLKSASEAMRLKNEILDHMERACLCKSPSDRRRMLSFVVVGAGPSGVEVAGAIGEMKKYLLSREYPEIRRDDISIILVEGADRVLRTMSPQAEKAYEYLGHLMVDVRLERTMTSYENNIVTLSDGEQIYCETVIWTAGITGETISGFAPETFGPGNRFIVDEYNRVAGCDDVFALGDIALMTTEKHKRGYPQLAQVAIQQAVNLAGNLNRHEFTSKFEYNDKGSMATVGRNRAVADLKHIHLFGRLAWMIWMFIHLISLLGMRNKLNVLINWVWAYFTYSTSLRLLVHTTKYPVRKRWDTPDNE